MRSNEKDAPGEAADGALGTDEQDEHSKILEEAHKMARDLGISLEEATRSVYASKGKREQKKTRTINALRDLSPGMSAINLRARVVTLHKGERSSGEGGYYFGMLGDAGTTISFSAWSDFDFSPGDAIFVQNASVREWKGRPEVVMNSYSFISPTDDPEGLSPPVEGSVPQSISELSPQSRKIDIECRIIELSSDEVTVKGQSREVRRGLLADRTGRMEFTCWGPLELGKGDCYRIIGGYVREFKGMQRFNFDAGAIVRSVPDDRLPPLEELQKPAKSRVMCVLDTRDSGPVLLRGTVLDVRTGSGLFKKCSECGRRLMKGICPIHGKVKGEDALGLKAVFDDGTGTAILKCEGTLIEELLGRDLSSISREVNESLDPDSVLVDLSRKVLLKQWTVAGDPFIDEYGLTVAVREMHPGWDWEEIATEIGSLLEVVA